MKKQISTLVPAFKAALQIVDGKIESNGNAVNAAFEAELQKVDENLNIDKFDKVMQTLSNSSNALAAAAAEISAEAFKADGELKETKFSTKIGKQATVDAGWVRERTYTPINPSTREEMPQVTQHNVMTGGRLVIEGVGSKSVRQHSREYGASLFE